MAEPTMEDKIQLLVKSVLEAVDARLDTVRHEIATFSNDVEQRHHQLLESMAALDARVDALAVAGKGNDAAAMDRLTSDLDALRRRVDALAATNASPASPAAPAPMPTALPVVEPIPAPDAAVITGAHQISREELDEISRPILTHITTQVPVVPDPTGHHEPVEHLPLRVPPVVAPHFGATPPAAPTTAPAAPATEGGGDEIDLDQLASLLNERLGSLTLPTRGD